MCCKVVLLREEEEERGLKNGVLFESLLREESLLTGGRNGRGGGGGGGGGGGVEWGRIEEVEDTRFVWEVLECGRLQEGRDHDGVVERGGERSCHIVSNIMQPCTRPLAFIIIQGVSNIL